jgi:hypothetical protein
VILESLRISFDFSEDEKPIEGFVGQLGLVALVAIGIWLNKSVAESAKVTKTAPVRRIINEVYRQGTEITTTRWRTDHTNSTFLDREKVFMGTDK